MHSLNVMHRDIKSANIMMTQSGQLKLADFNVSKVLGTDNMLRTQTGTPYYASPEVWNNEPYSIKSDMWSLGCVMYEIVTGRVPFKANDFKSLRKKVVSCQYPPMGPLASRELQRAIFSLLTVEPNLRPDCDTLLQNPEVVSQIENLLARGDENVRRAVGSFYDISETGRHFNSRD